MTGPAKDLNGKVALIGGGAGAIGLATARRLAAGAARVVIADLPDAGAGTVAAALRA